MVKESSPATGSEHGTETKHRSRLSQLAREISAAARSNISAPRMDLAAISNISAPRMDLAAISR
jgi:hypothetical protein